MKMVWRHLNLRMYGVIIVVLTCGFFMVHCVGKFNLDLVKQLAAANTQFGLDLYKKVSEKKGSNLFLSPFSISTALGMTHLGARGNTAVQMSQVLKWMDLKETVHSAFEDYLGILKKSHSSYVLTTANRLFINNKYKILDEFLQKTDQHYKAKAVLADFVGNGDGEAKKINEWVESETNKKIRDLITGGIDPATAMILVNAIYFKGNWEKQFDPSKTSKGIFKVKPGENVHVDMMHMEEEFNFGVNKDLKCRVLELPYVDKELSMFFLLPFNDDGLNDLEQKLDWGSLKLALKQVSYKTVNIAIPKFVLETSFNLNDILESLGMSDAFDGSKADLSGIDGTQLLFISRVVHKTFLEVNEEGSEAAAATEVEIVVESAAISDSESFMADHPFLFLIRDNRADFVLFVGRFVRPPVDPQQSAKAEL